MTVIDKWLNPDIDAITPYQPGRPIEEVAREMGMAPSEISKLASNENPLGASPKALAALREKLSETFRYPDGGAYYLREKLAARFDVDRERIVLGAGSNEILEFIGHCFMAEGRSVVVSAHAFVIYKLIARMFNARVIEVPATTGLAHDLDAMADAIEPDTCAVFVCNPNNPTGTLAGHEDVTGFVDKVPGDVLVVFDEAYAEIALAPMPDTLRIVNARSNCLMLRTFSKAYGLAGLRIGFGIGPAPVVGALQKSRQPFNVNRLAQEAAFAALDDDDFLARSRALFAESKAYLEEQCREMGLSFIPTTANFLLINVGDAAQVTEDLTKHGVIVRPMAGYGLPNHIRLSFGTMPENRNAVSRLQAVL